ncbi:hypothetical protein Q5H92_15015 [Hymenobacter sp. M29]|uniref:Uncharacterized protein n=1 Tax=Hymenobacter mellowenesis TaxID=3063995 RepID=A0ABT9ACU5_9BACT|nr:hypothetical protein [Hymenobacter sp. M29]MDO7847678.1 hypothetical protein [Hymenobacter sp. M29]
MPKKKLEHWDLNAQINGPMSLLEAAYKEIQTRLPHYEENKGQGKDRDTSIFPTVIKLFTYVNEKEGGYWWSGWCAPRGDQELTLPQDWDQLMDILEGLKQPKVPEYVLVNGKVLKIKGVTPDRLNMLDAYTVKGEATRIPCPLYTPVTEEEFIQGGLKELEEAGFVVGAKAKGPLSTDREYNIGKMEYLDTKTEGGYIHSPLTVEEVTRVGFCFTVKGEGWSIPVGQCTLLPKAQTLPTTKSGIPYLINRDNLYLGPNPSPNPLFPETTITLKASQLRYMMKQGVTGIVTKVGHLDKEDLTKVLSV